MNNLHTIKPNNLSDEFIAGLMWHSKFLDPINRRTFIINIRENTLRYTDLYETHDNAHCALDHIAEDEIKNLDRSIVNRLKIVYE